MVEGFGYDGREYKVSGQEVGWRRGHAAQGAACFCQRVTGERAWESRGGVVQIKGDVSSRGCATRKQCKVTSFTQRSVSSMRR